MAYTLKQIRDALAALNPSDDAHWTGQGLPKMEVVCAGLPGVTRRELAEAAPGFCRTDLSMPDDDEPAVVAPPAVVAEAAMVDAGVTPDPADPLAPVLAKSATRDAAEAALEARLVAARKLKAEAIARMVAAKAEADQIDRQIAEAQNELDLDFPPLTEAEKYQLIVRRGQQEKMRRVESEQAARAVLGHASKSPLDRAMSAKRGYGLQRPRYPMVRG